MLSQVQVYLNQNPGDAAMTIEHMRHLFRSGSPQAQQLIQRMCRYGANITPTFSPWAHTSDDSYIYQLSLVLATATVSFFFFGGCAAAALHSSRGMYWKKLDWFLLSV